MDEQPTDPGGASDRRETTVAFELAALEAVTDPEAVFAQTQGWARSVGILSDRPTHVITSRARSWGIDYGFTGGPRDLLESLGDVRAQPEHDADRYLLIATDAIDPSAVTEQGWAYLPLPEAAEAGGWTVAAEASPAEQPDDRGWP